MRLSVDFYENLVQVPLPIGVSAQVLDAFLANFCSKNQAEPVPPVANRFVADVDAALVQQVLDVPERKREANIHHHRQANYFWAAVKILERVAFLHGQTLRNQPARLKAIPSDKTPDRSKGYADTRRVLKSGGHYILSVWDRIESNELADIVTREAGNVFPDNPPQFLARTPHGYFDLDVIRFDLERSGFSDIVINVSEETSIAPSAGVAAKAYCHGTPLRNEIEERDPAMLDHVVDKAAAAIEAQFGKGPIESKICALVVTATK